jgi:hypothetical protein
MHNSGAADFIGRLIILPISKVIQVPELSAVLSKRNLLFKPLYGKQCTQIFRNELLRFYLQTKMQPLNLIH